MAHNESKACCTTDRAVCAPNAIDATPVERTARVTFRPAVDVLDADDAYRIVADLPGSSADRVRISFEEGVLTIDADVPERSVEGREAVRQEYGVGAFHRRFRVHGEVDVEAISASYAHGVLTVTLPKSTRSRARRIPVNAN